MRVLYYLEVNLICIVVLALFLHQFHNKSRQYSFLNAIFRLIICVTMLVCASDIFSGVFLNSDFFLAISIMELANIIFFSSLGIISYLWMIYVFVKLEVFSIPGNKAAFIWSIPLIIMCVLLVFNPTTHFFYFFTEEGEYVRGPGVALHWIVTGFYFLMATLKPAILLSKEDNIIKRDAMKPLLFFSVAPAIGALIQVLHYGVISVQVGIVISIIMIFLDDQDKQILSDSLTGLNNRRGFDHYLEGHFQHHSADELYIILLDLDGFKQINDGYGHMAGDHALTVVADCLKKVCSRATRRLFLCRYGGDEFLIAVNRYSTDELNQLTDDIREAIGKLNINSHVNYDISASIGYAIGQCKNKNDVLDIIHRADESMYKEKTNKKA